MDKATRPNRGDLDDPDIKWRDGKPDYELADEAYFSGRSKAHKEGSLEKLVEDLVKTWEMEVSHKLEPTQWTTIAPERFRLVPNGGRCEFDVESVNRMGNYNVLLGGCPAWKEQLADSSFEDSHTTFRKAFPRGFPWELLQVVSGPTPLPDESGNSEVIFSWRHWSHFSGPYEKHQGGGEIVEMFGLCRAIMHPVKPDQPSSINSSGLEAKLKIGRLEVYLDAQSFLETLEGSIDDDGDKKEENMKRFRDLESAKRAVEEMKTTGRWTMD